MLNGRESAKTRARVFKRVGWLSDFGTRVRLSGPPACTTLINPFSTDTLLILLYYNSTDALFVVLIVLLVLILLSETTKKSLDVSQQPKGLDSLGLAPFSLIPASQGPASRTPRDVVTAAPKQYTMPKYRGLVPKGLTSNRYSACLYPNRRRLLLAIHDHNSPAMSMYSTPSDDIPLETDSRAAKA